LKTELEIESELIVNVEGDYTPKTKSYFDHNLGNWLPGESAGIENFKVFIVNTNKKVEITDVISEKELDKLKNEFLEYCIWED
jgi:hypothetical protein